MKKAILTAWLAASFAGLWAQEPPFQRENITIARDGWGVPHIFSKTDAEAAYGIAWAHCEDDFKTIQEMMLICKARAGEHMGVNGAVLDFLVQFTGLRELVEQRYDTDIDPKVKVLLEASCAAFNRFAARHPEQVLIKNAFPVTPKDMVVGFNFTVTLLNGFPFVVQHILENKLDQYKEGFVVRGSNAFAANPNKTADGKTYLCTNSHQPLQGLFSWYEVYVDTEEGWNMLGGIWPGGNMIFHGIGKELGWACTLNWNDFVDFYKLETDRRKNYYKFDGEWKRLEKVKIPLKVKVGPLKLKVTRKAYKTVYGPALKNKTGVYAVRTSTIMDVRLPNQQYALNKAKNLDEFKDALRMAALGSVNFVYADKNENIYYVSNGCIPARDPAFDWKKTLPGNTSKTLWKSYVPFDKLPQLQNPPCGYLFSSNHTPFNATCKENNLKPENYDKTMGIQQYDNNRSRRYTELMDNGRKITYDDFKRFKYDVKYPDYGAFIDSLKPFYDLKSEEYPKIAAAIRKIQRWNKSADIHNKDGAAALVAFIYMFKKLKAGSYEVETGLKADKKLFVEAIEYAQKYLVKHFKTIDVPFGELQRHIKGGVNLPMYGMPDVLGAMFSEEFKGGKGRWKSATGDSYIQFARYGKNGLEHIETVNAYGASNNPGSPHYTDQMERFVNQKPKTMTFERRAILEKAERVYHPD